MCALVRWIFPEDSLSVATWLECRLVLCSLHDWLSLKQSRLVMAWGSDAAKLLQDTAPYMTRSSENDMILQAKWLSMVDIACVTWETIVKGQTIFSTPLDDLEEAELQLPIAGES